SDVCSSDLFHDKARSLPAVPTPEVSTAEDAPALSLSAPAPELAVIDGHAETAPVAEAAPGPQLQTMPVAVGQTRAVFSAEYSATGHAAVHAAGHGVAGHAAGGHGVAGHAAGGYGQTMAGGHGRSAAGNVRMLHPAVHAVFNDSSRPAGQSGSGVPGRQSRPAHGHPASARSAGGDLRAGDPRATGARGGAPRTVQPGTSRGGDLGGGVPRPGGPLNSNPNLGADEEHAMTEQATTLRESLTSLGTMVRGFALVLLASVLGVVVTSVLALFSVVHIALAGVFLGLGVVSLFIVRTLNLRRREVRKRL